MKASFTRTFVSTIVMSALSACASQQQKPQLVAPIVKSLTLAEFQADYVCTDNSVPGFANGTVAIRCANKSQPQPASPITPLAWRKLGYLWHSGDPVAHLQATNSVKDSRGLFYDITGSYDLFGCSGWRSVMSLPCLDGSMNIVWQRPVPDLRKQFGTVAFGFSTLWGQPLAYFNGLQCSARPSGNGVRYPIFASGVPKGKWTQIPVWWPNGKTTQDCDPDSDGRSATNAIYYGPVKRLMTVNGVSNMVTIDEMISETYWFPTPTPEAMEKLGFDYRLGTGWYELWCDSNLPPSVCAPDNAPTPDFFSPDGINVSQPSIPTGDGGTWTRQIVVDFNDIEGEAWSLAPGPKATGMPPGWSAQQFLSSAPEFPGDSPMPVQVSVR